MKSVGHLDERSYALLLGGRLPPAEARALAAHLEAECASCEAFLAERPAVDPVDGFVDRALGALSDEGAAGSEAELARILGRLRAQPPGAAPRRRRTHGLSLALAAGVIAAGAAGLLLGRAPERARWDGEKGEARPIPARLGFVVLTPRPGGPALLEKGVPGESVSAAASLQFEVEIARAADVALVRVPPRGAPEVFWHERLPPGRSAVTLAGRPAAYPLAELSGPQRFVLVAGEAPLDDARLVRSTEALAPPARVSADLPGLDGLSLDVVEVVVR